MIVPTSGDPSTADLAEVALAVGRGEIVAIPTDTVYGLAADPFQPAAIKRLFDAKQRPASLAVPVLVSGTEQALGLASAVPDAAIALMDAFWPGALTIVLSCRAELAAALRGNGPDGPPTVGLRHPDHRLPVAICEKAGPLATTSANLHGQPTPTTAAEVEAMFGDLVAVVLDGGASAGLASTVVDCTGAEPRLLRQGRIAWPDVLAVVS
ncbi:MAG: L-threonylcarbamoyladenylate synthase [Acidimicrobiales bacterium]